jgi:hypothetical protein
MVIKNFESYSGKSIMMYGGYWSSNDMKEEQKVLKGEILYPPGPPHDRIEVLKDMGFKVLYDEIDYDYEWEYDKCKSMFRKEIARCHNVDIIMGFSLGGYTAYKMAGHLSKDLILVNPAIDRSKTMLDIKEFNYPTNKNFKDVELYVGDRDDLIPMRYSINYLKKEGVRASGYIVKNMAHRTPIHFFEQIVKSSKILNP